jgi:predicted glycogen debranching enzyme
MDVKIDDWVVTPRIGKPVEVNALWYNALRVMAALARRLAEPAAEYDALAEAARAGFERFWNPATRCCFDVLDGPNGPEATLRPNQLFAVSLPHSPLTAGQQRAVVEVCARRLLTSLGLRTLPPDDANYHPRYNGDRVTRDTAYHQGTVWPWLIGPFVSAHFRVYGDRAAALSFLDPLLRHLSDHGLGSLSEVADADPPHTPHACPAQAWSVAEVLRAWRELADIE